jgi:hypothetical protein
MILNTPFQEIVEAIFVISNKFRADGDEPAADLIEQKIDSIFIHIKAEEEKWHKYYEDERKNKKWWQKLLDI